jgi:N-acetylmuramoyl-L-alanine amidase
MLITVTAGHGGSDPGAVNGPYTERELMTRLRDIVALKLREMGHQVRTDGKPGENLSLNQAIAQIAGSDIAIELHTNAAAALTARGVEVVGLPQHRERSQRLAAAIARVMESPMRGDRGWIDQSRTARGRLGYVNAGGLVVEVFFLSNRAELDRYLSRVWLVASAIAEAINRERP